MIKKWSSLLLFIVFSFTTSAKQSSEEKIIAKQVKDFEIFKTSLYELEANLFDHISEDSLAYYLDELKNLCSSKIVDNKSLYKAYSLVLVKIQSGHTNLQPTQDTYKYWIIEKNSLPMDVLMVGKKLYTHSDYNLLSEEKMKQLSGSAKKQNTIPKYTEIYSIDGKTIPELMNAISPYLSSDYNQISFKYFLVKDLFEFYRNLSLPLDQNKTELDVQFIIKRDTLTKTIPLGYPPVDEINKRFKEDKKNKKKVKRSERFGTFELISGKYAYFRFPSFEKSKGKKYRKFLDKSFEQIKKKEIEYMIVDLRDNTGGYVQYDFLSYLFPKIDIDTLGQFVVKKEKNTVGNTF